MAQILVVDDSSMHTNVMRRMLQRHGHEVITAASGEEGVEIAQHEMPDVIMMDVVMPGMNGFQATRQITRNKYTEHIPVILVSSKSQEADKMWGERQGAKGYLVKPIDEDSLIRVLNEMLELL